MPVVCLGIDHRTAPITLRERLTFSERERDEFYSNVDLTDLERRTGLSEVAVLSTCNRVEIYAAARDPGRRFEAVPRTLAGLLVRKGAPGTSNDASHLYAHSETAAVRHLARVAAGLDSMVLGESEILGQVRAAHDQATARRVTGPVLQAVFRAAIGAGRRARAETAIGRMPASVSSEAIRVAECLTGSLAHQHVLIVGTGKMGQLAGRICAKKGVRHLSLISRTKQHVLGLATEWGATPLAWHELGHAIAKADVVLSSTGAPHTVITRELVQTAVRTRRSEHLLFIDVAVPRDVDDDVADLPGVSVVNIDGLRAGVDEHLANRMRAVPEVEKIVEESVCEFEEWRRQAELRPLLAAFRARIEEVRQQELRRAEASIGTISPEVADQLDRFSQSLTNKLFRGPMRRLRNEMDAERCNLLQQAARDLFALADELDARSGTDNG